MIQKMVDNTIRFMPLNNLQYYFDFRTMVVVINQTRKQVKHKLELWRKVSESNRLAISNPKHTIWSATFGEF